MSSFFLQAMEKLHHIRKDIEYVYQAWNAWHTSIRLHEEMDKCLTNPGWSYNG